jgi:hypothetical protein
MAKVAPTLAEIEALRADAPDGPVVMINLIKFKPGGAEAFDRYMAVAAECLTDVVPELVYAGKVGADAAGDAEWDLIALMRYPSFEGFAQLMAHPIYQERAIPLREQAMERAMLSISTPMAGLAVPE